MSENQGIKDSGSNLTSVDKTSVLRQHPFSGLVEVDVASFLQHHPDPFQSDEMGDTPFSKLLDEVSEPLNTRQVYDDQSRQIANVQERLADDFLNAVDLDSVRVDENNIRGLTQMNLMISDDHPKRQDLTFKMNENRDVWLHPRSEANLAWDLHAQTHGWNRPLEVWAHQNPDDQRGMSQLKKAYDRANTTDDDPLRPNQRAAFVQCPVSGDLISARTVERQQQRDEQGRNELHQVFERGEGRLSRDQVENSFAHARYVTQTYGFVDPMVTNNKGQTPFERGLEVLEEAVRKNHIQVFDAAEMGEDLAQSIVKAPAFDVQKAYQENPDGTLRLVSMLTPEERDRMKLSEAMPDEMKQKLSENPDVVKDVVALRRELYQEPGVDDKTRLRWPLEREGSVSQTSEGVSESVNPLSAAAQRIAARHQASSPVKPRVEQASPSKVIFHKTRDER